jgi:acetoin utilization deacetylase AcuC-like enzyme
MQIITDERCVDYQKAGHPERPARIRDTTARLLGQRTVPLTWVAATPADPAAVLRAHTPEHLARLREASDFDADTPWYPGIAETALRAAGAALQGMAAARAGQPAFSLMRPPGHHALSERAMGFCYLSNAAIAALAARDTGTKRVVVFDFDVHHGNGTEELLVDREGTAYVSVHRSPGFPHTGLVDRGSNCKNHPVAPRAPRSVYRDALSRALADVVAVQPELLVVSAGFDAYVSDPIGRELLELDDYHWLGTELRALGVPMCHLLEGGYSDELPDVVLAYLDGLCLG